MALPVTDPPHLPGDFRGDTLAVTPDPPRTRGGGIQERAMIRRLTDRLNSTTRVLQYVGFGSKAALAVPRQQQSAYEMRPAGSPELHDRLHEPGRPRLERGHPTG